MKREISLEEISDGKRYGLNDMVRADSGGCRGCSACCRGMGRSIVLDPLDVMRIARGLGMTFAGLLQGQMELNVADGIVLPNLKMAGETEQCAFLDDGGRCQIHAFRPGICRIFPLGRIYEDGSFRYFLQAHECREERRSKVKVRRWVDTQDLGRYEAYIAEWHYFLLDIQEKLGQRAMEEDAKKVSMLLLKLFYFDPFDHKADCYPQFEARMAAAQKLLKEELA